MATSQKTSLEMTEEELRRHIKTIAKPQHIWGKKHGIDQSVISMVVNGRRDPPEKLLNAIGYQLDPKSYSPTPTPHKRKAGNK